jgi:outer membrane protein assembly factor BamB
VPDGLVYIADLAGYLHCLDAVTGTRYWYNNVQTTTWSSPYWVDGRVYLGTDDGNVVVFAHGKDKRVLAEDNELRGTIRATPAAANGVLYINNGRELYAITSMPR